jgi:hypothetical protein
MPLQPERIFDPARPVFVRRFLVAAGRHLNPGDAFSWRQWALNERRVRQLFDAGKLTHDAPQRADLAGLQARDMAAAAPLTPAPTVEQETQDDDIHHVAVTTPAADPQPAATVESDGLDELTMAELRQIAAEENAPLRASKSAQRDAIRETRNANTAV